MGAVEVQWPYQAGSRGPSYYAQVTVVSPGQRRAQVHRCGPVLRPQAGQMAKQYIRDGPPRSPTVLSSDLQGAEPCLTNVRSMVMPVPNAPMARSISQHTFPK